MYPTMDRLLEYLSNHPLLAGAAGMVLGATVVRTRSLLVALAWHAAFNIPFFVFLACRSSRCIVRPINARTRATHDSASRTPCIGSEGLDDRHQTK